MLRAHPDLRSLQLTDEAAGTDETIEAIEAETNGTDAVLGFNLCDWTQGDGIVSVKTLAQALRHRASSERARSSILLFARQKIDLPALKSALEKEGISAEIWNQFNFIVEENLTTNRWIHLDDLWKMAQANLKIQNRRLRIYSAEPMVCSESARQWLQENRLEIIQIFVSGQTANITKILLQDLQSQAAVLQSQ